MIKSDKVIKVIKVIKLQTGPKLAAGWHSGMHAKNTTRTQRSARMSQLMPWDPCGHTPTDQDVTATPSDPHQLVATSIGGDRQEVTARPSDPCGTPTHAPNWNGGPPGCHS